MYEPSLQVVLVAGASIDEVPSLFRHLAINVSKFIEDDTIPTTKPAESATAKSMAYIIFTSGSTGKPKGVMVPHGGVYDRIAYHPIMSHLGPGTRMLQTFSVGFDACLEEIFHALVSGATVVVWNRMGLLPAVATVDVMQISPTGLSQFTPEQLPRLRAVCVGVEPVQQAVVDKWADHIALYSDYGPTEATMVATATDRLRPGMRVTLGRPLTNTRIHIIDDKLRHVPVGVKGRIFIGGVGIAMGYLNRPDLTAERFVEEIGSTGESDGSMMYDTGDVGRWTMDGQIEFQNPPIVESPKDDFHARQLEAVEVMKRFLKSKYRFAPDQSTQSNNISSSTPSILDNQDPYSTLGGYGDFMQIPDDLKDIYSEALGIDPSELASNGSFIGLGGDSISAVRMVSKSRQRGIHLTAAQLLNSNTLQEIVEHAKSNTSKTVWPKAQISDKSASEINDVWESKLGLVGSQYDMMPTTPLQAGMVAATMRDRSAYVGQFVLRANEVLCKERILQAFKTIVVGNEILRSTFVTTTADGVVRIVQNEAKIDAPKIAYIKDTDAGRHTDALSHNMLNSYVEADRNRGFEIGDRMWVRLALLNVESDGDQEKADQVIVFTIHHALYDGWSLPMLLSDLVAAYTGTEIVPRPPFRSVVDYMCAQDAEATAGYWRETLDGVDAAEPLVLGRSNDGVDEDGNEASLARPSSMTTEQLRTAARVTRTTIASVLRTAWALTLRKYTRSSDVVFGHAVSNREIPVVGADRIVGPLLNTIACRVRIDDNASTVDLVRAVQDDHASALAHSHAALLDVTRWAGLPTDAKLFSTLFVYENMPMDNVAPEQDLLVHENVTVTGQDRALAYSFELIVYPDETVHTLTAKYDAAHMDRWMAQSVLAEYDYTLTRLVESLTTNTSVRLADMWELSPAQRSLLDETSRGDTVALPYETVHAGFEARARLHPDRVAVEHGDESLTYGQLDAAADALAARLAELSVCVGFRVGVVMRRSLSFVAGLAGVLRAGGAVVPVDASFPAARVQFMLADAGCRVVVASPDVAAEVDALGLDDMDIAVVWTDAHALAAEGVTAAEVDLCDNAKNASRVTGGKACRQRLFAGGPQHEASGNDEFMVVYTSGSTGKPKGVPVLHVGAANVVHTCSPQIGCVDGARVAQFMAIGFDVCEWEIWGALNHGCVLVLREEDAFATVRKVDVLMTTPTGLSQIGNPAQSSLKSVWVTGEMCPISLKNKWCEDVRFFNGGGPTEVTILSHLCLLTLEDPVMYGCPVANMHAYVLDEVLQWVPVGVVGEMYTGGVGLSKGYIGRDDLTMEKFIVDPFAQVERDGKPARMFKTGDLGRLHADGRLEILGRMDDQVKLRGYRVELDEVAAALMRGPGVTAAAAVVKDGSVLVGFVTPAGVDTNAVREAAATMLPAYMVPAVIVALDRMPTNANGKTDKKALAAMDVRVETESPATEAERVLAGVWASVLGVSESEIGRATSFFALGGDSISSIRVVARARQAGLVLSTSIVFKSPTLASMAAASTPISITESPSHSLDNGPVSGLVELTPIQRLFFSRSWVNINHFNQGFMLRLRRTVDYEQLKLAVSAIVVRHDMLRARYHLDPAGSNIPESTWRQTVLAPSSNHADANVNHIVIKDSSEIELVVKAAQESLSLTHGPVHTALFIDVDVPGEQQRLLFTAHHLVVDLVSWRIILGDLEDLLNGRSIESLGPRTTSFQTWSSRMVEHASSYSAKAWMPYMGPSMPPLALVSDSCGQDIGVDREESACIQTMHVASAMDEATTSQLDAANAAYGTNIQDLALAALVAALASVQADMLSNRLESSSVTSNGLILPTNLCIDLEGHGREPWTDELDVSVTVGWFTSVYPVVLQTHVRTGSDGQVEIDLPSLIKTVKQTVRSVPDRGLSYGAIKYLAPATESNAAIKTHAGHPIGFNYLGRFQTLQSGADTRETKTAGLFEAEHSVNTWSIRPDDAPLHACELVCAHDGPRLVMNAVTMTTFASRERLQSWLSLWSAWMERIVSHCVDPDTVGGRVPADVPLLSLMAARQKDRSGLFQTRNRQDDVLGKDDIAISQDGDSADFNTINVVLSEAETGLADKTGLRPRDIEDMYPATSLQSAMLVAMMRDPAEYVLQGVYDVRGDVDVRRLRSAWTQVVKTHVVLRTVFVLTSCGIVQAVARDDHTEWNELDETWPSGDSMGSDMQLDDDGRSCADKKSLGTLTTQFLKRDRQRGFTLSNRSYVRFTAVRVSDGRTRLFMTQHHAIIDGWSMPIVMNGLLRACAGAVVEVPGAPFRDHVEWILSRPENDDALFWREALKTATNAGRLALTRPQQKVNTTSSPKYRSWTTKIDAHGLDELCRNHGVTVSSVLRTAWALALRHYTRTDDVLFGAVVSGRDTGVAGIEGMVGVLINTIPVAVHLPLSASMADVLGRMHEFSGAAMAHSHCSLVDVAQWSGLQAQILPLETLLVFENYPTSEPGVTLPFSFSMVQFVDYWDAHITIMASLSNTTLSFYWVTNTSLIQFKMAQEASVKFQSYLHHLIDSLGSKKDITIMDMVA